MFTVHPWPETVQRLLLFCYYLSSHQHQHYLVYSPFNHCPSSHHEEDETKLQTFNPIPGRCSWHCSFRNISRTHQFLFFSPQPKTQKKKNKNRPRKRHRYGAREKVSQIRPKDKLTSKLLIRRERNNNISYKDTFACCIQHICICMHTVVLIQRLLWNRIYVTHHRSPFSWTHQHISTHFCLPFIFTLFFLHVFVSQYLMSIFFLLINLLTFVHNFVRLSIVGVSYMYCMRACVGVCWSFG